MKKLHFDYYMQIDYTIEVSRCNFTIKCIPKNDARQRIENIQLEMYPNAYYNTGVDGLKNQQIYGLNEDPHKTFFFQISGDAVTGLADYEEAEDDHQTMIFRHAHGLNQSGKAIRGYFEKIQPDPDLNNLKKAEAIMHSLHEAFQYKPFTTNMNTTAEEAFAQGHGVCQDYAHIFIALLHLAKIPARYVTGLLIGEGETHAWVEIMHDQKWYGLDPTNNTKVTDNHIKIGVGRDAKDCLINRGIMHGGGLHTQTVKVTVKEVGEKKHD